MARVLPLVVPLIALGLGACARTSPTNAPSPPSLRVVSVGIESMTDPKADLRELNDRIAQSGANGVAISAGRLDWTTFPWPGHADQWSHAVEDSGRDLFAEAVSALGAERHLSAVIDVFAPRLLAEHPELAAVDWRGQRSTLQVSLASLTSGTAGHQLLQMIEHVARTYPVDSIDLTELHYDSVGFGDDDRRSYLAATGRVDWPRRDDGEIDLTDQSIGTWRSRLLADFVARAAAVTHRYGKQLFVDARVSWEHPELRGRQYGQDYDALLAHADRLVVWDYFALSDRRASDTRELVDQLASLDPQRFIVSIGLWSDGGFISPGELQRALALLGGRGLAGAWVTPVSGLDTARWRALGSVWG
jgi:hypothetical protein